MENAYDAYLRWIECSRLINVQAMTLLSHGCTHAGYYLNPATNEFIKVTLKKIVAAAQDAQSFNFNEVNYFTSKQCK